MHLPKSSIPRARLKILRHILFLFLFPNGCVLAQVSRVVDSVYGYLDMAGSRTAADYTPITQPERTRLYLNSMVNPILYFKAGLSGAIDQKNDKPKEWEQGASGYGKRTANILSQYVIQRTVTFGLSSALHEDNRFFGSGRKGFWNRTGHAIVESVLARHENGKQYPSISLFGGYAAAAFISRSWQPPSTRSAGDGAVSFGLSTGYNTLASVAKEFLPDVLHPHAKNHKP